MLIIYADNIYGTTIMIDNDRKSSRKVLTIILCFLVIFCGLGLMQPRGQFVVPITQALGISRSVYSINDTIRFATSAVLNFFFAFFIEKFGSKVLICAGFVAFTCGALLFGFAEHVALLYVGSFLFGVGWAWSGTAIVGRVVRKVCGKNLGVVLGIVMAANGIGGAVASQVYAPFLTRSNADNPFGYQGAYFLMAAIFAFVFLMLLIFFKDPKTSSDWTAQKKQRSLTWEGIEFKQAKKTVYFYLVCICIFITGFSLQGLSSVRPAFLEDVGLSRAFIATLASVGAIVLTFSKFLNGLMYQKLGLRLTVTICIICELIGIVLLFFIKPNTVGEILSYAYMILLNIAMPLETVMLPVYASELFGEKSFNNVLGIFVAVHQVGSALSSPGMNVSYDLTGSYISIFVVLGVLMAIMLITVHIAISSANRIKNKVMSSDEEIQE